MKALLKKIKPWLKKAVRVVLNPRALLCVGIAWMLTNGWAYVALGIGTLLGLEWLIGVSGVYLSLLWVPFTPEKLLTAAIAFLLLRWLFPKDEQTLGVLRELFQRTKRKVRQRVRRRRPDGEGEG